MVRRAYWGAPRLVLFHLWQLLCHLPRTAHNLLQNIAWCDDAATMGRSRIGECMQSLKGSLPATNAHLGTVPDASDEMQTQSIEHRGEDEASESVSNAE